VSVPAGISINVLMVATRGAWLARGIAPLRVMIFHSELGTFPNAPVTGLIGDKVRKIAGLKKVIVKGLEIECEVTPVWVPPKAVTAHCFPKDVGAISTDIVYVGLVKPVWAPPVTGVDRDIDIFILNLWLKNKPP